MNQTVIKIGNSLGIIIPQRLREENGIAAGDTIALHQAQNKGDILLSKVKKTIKPSKLTTRFAQMVDEFMTEHEDVLQELAKK